MYNFLLIIFFFVAIIIIALVMLQPSKGCEIRSNLKTVFYSTRFGTGGYGNFINYITTILAIIFFILSLLLCTMNSNIKKNYINK